VKVAPVKQKTLREEAHSRVRKMLLPQPRSARESASGLFVLACDEKKQLLLRIK